MTMERNYPHHESRIRTGMCVCGLASSQLDQIGSKALSAGGTECFWKRDREKLERFVERFADSHVRRITGRVLLVEDSGTCALFCREVLERTGLQVEVCSDAPGAIALFEREDFDLVLTDYVLSGALSGLSVIGSVRETPGSKGFNPILAISSFNDTARRMEILRSGANDFVSKPMVAEELEARVFNMLSAQKLMRQLELQHEAMKEMARHDPLTALHNRCYLDEAVPALIEEAQRRNEHLSLIVLDLDHFKEINDSGGHKLGDLVLEQAARAMPRCCCNHDVVARLGGDEFLVVLPGATSADAFARGDEIRRRIAGVLPGGKVTASLGIASLLPGEDYDALFRRADSALYRAKDGGGTRAVLAVAGGTVVDGLEVLSVSHGQGGADVER